MAALKAPPLPDPAAPLKWSFDRPNVPGFFWIRGTNLSPRIADFTIRGSQILCGYDDLKHYGKPQFAGPIPLPLDA